MESVNGEQLMIDDDGTASGNARGSPQNSLSFALAQELQRGHGAPSVRARRGAAPPVAPSLRRLPRPRRSPRAGQHG